MISRRAILASAATVPAVALAACSTTQIQNFEAQWAAAQAWIAQQVQVVTKVLPTVESIAAVAAGLFGPSYQALVTIGSGLANQVIAAIVAVINAAAPPPTPAPQAKLKAMLHGGSVASVVVGNTGPLPYAWQGVTIAVVK